jgi:hypothetical protein
LIKIAAGIIKTKITTCPFRFKILLPSPIAEAKGEKGQAASCKQKAESSKRWSTNYEK